MTTETPELKPCLHCGGKAAKEHQGPNERIRCTDCCVMTAWYSGNHGGDASAAWNRRSAASAEPAVAVKALIWHMSNAAEHWIAHHPFGEYTIVRDHRASSETTHGWFSQGRWIWVGSLDEAKAAVHADYNQRIRSVLAAPPSPVVSEEMVRQAFANVRPDEMSTPDLPDDLRVPLHELQADLDYLFGRVAADGSVAGMMADAVRNKLSQIEIAALALANAALSPAPAGEVGWRTMEPHAWAQWALVTKKGGMVLRCELLTARLPFTIDEENGDIKIKLLGEPLALYALPASPTGGDKP